MEENEFLTVTETAKILGLNRETVLDYINEGIIPAIRFKRVYRVSKKALMTLIDQKMVIPDVCKEE